MKINSSARLQKAQLLVSLVILTLVVIAFELFKYNTSLFKSLEILYSNGGVYILLGAVVSTALKFLLILFFGFSSFTRYYSRLQYTILVATLTLWFFGLNINHFIYYRALGLFVGTQLCLVIDSYLGHRDFKKMLKIINSSAKEEKELVVANIDIFYSHFVKAFEYHGIDDDTLKNYFNLLSGLFVETNPIDKLRNLSVTDSMYIQTGYELICEFMSEHKALVNDDKGYYSKIIKDADIDGFIVSQRWYILWRTEKFIYRWKIEPKMAEPFFTENYISKLVG